MKRVDDIVTFLVYKDNKLELRLVPDSEYSKEYVFEAASKLKHVMNVGY